MNVDLPPDAMQFLQRLVASGEFQSAELAVAEGVRLLMSRQQVHVEIRQGINELDSGQGLDGKRVFAELRERAGKSSQRAD